MFRGIRNLFSERTEGSDDPETYKKVRVVEIDDTTAQLATDEGEFTVYDVGGLKLSALPKIGIDDLDYDISYRTFYIEFKTPATIRVKKKEGLRYLVVVF